MTAKSQPGDAKMGTPQPAMPGFHCIRWIHIVGGFMDGTKIEFAPGLNCIIGARGTGKTTVLEFIRVLGPVWKLLPVELNVVVYPLPPLVYWTWCVLTSASISGPMALGSP